MASLPHGWPLLPPLKTFPALILQNNPGSLSTNIPICIINPIGCSCLNSIFNNGLLRMRISPPGLKIVMILECPKCMFRFDEEEVVSVVAVLLVGRGGCGLGDGGYRTVF